MSIIFDIEVIGFEEMIELKIDEIYRINKLREIETFGFSLEDSLVLYCTTDTVQ